MSSHPSAKRHWRSFKPEIVEKEFFPPTFVLDKHAETFDLGKIHGPTYRTTADQGQGHCNAVPTFLQLNPTIISVSEGLLVTDVVNVENFNIEREALRRKVNITL